MSTCKDSPAGNREPFRSFSLHGTGRQNRAILPAQLADRGTGSQMTAKTVELAWAEKRKIWYVAKSEIPGLVSEAPTYEALMNRVIGVVPNLVALNRIDYDGNNLLVRFTTDQTVEYPLLGG
jgi:hypothetical protein